MVRRTPLKKKTSKKKSTTRKAPRATARKGAPARAEKAIGVVTHYYGGIGVGIVKFKKPVKVGMTLEFRGATTNFTQALTSMQYDHNVIQSAPKGKEVGIKTKKRVREGDEVFEVK